MSKKLKGNLAGKSKAKRAAIFKAAAKGCAGKSGKAKSKPRKKTRTIVLTGRTRGVRTMTKKPKTSARRKGELERKKLKFKKEFNDLARGLGAPLSKTIFKMVGRTWRLKIPPLKTIKRVKLADAMRELRKRVKKRI